MDPLASKSHYFLGQDRQKWKTGISHYSKVHYEEVYPGVDVVYYGNQGLLEYDYIIAPGADPSVIKLEFDGIDKLEIGLDGDLVASFPAGQFRLYKPHVYQIDSGGSPRAVSSSYSIRERSQVGFELGDFDASLPLVIDPVLSYSTYLGGSEDDWGLGVAVDTEGNAFVVGATDSANFPTSNQGASSGGTDIFITKLNPAGNGLIYSVYLGGSAAEIGRDVVLDPSGNACVLGGTRSANFPITPGALQTTLHGASDAFVVKLSADGSQLLYSTYLGGSGEEGFEGGSIAVDADGQAYITGTTDSLDFPTSRVTYQRAYGGGASDAFVSKLSADGSRLVYSTYLGGFDLDQGHGITVDSGGRTYVTGRTRSPNFVLHNAFQTFRRSVLDDAFVTKFNISGDLVTYSTFLGGSGTEVGYAIANDAFGNTFVAGETDSSNFPTTPDAIKTEHSEVDTDGFVTKLKTTSAREDSLAGSTYFGGSGNDSIRDIAVNPAGVIYFTGTADSVDFPVRNAAQSSFGGGTTDGVASKLSSDVKRIIYSTYLGGSEADSGVAIALAPASSAIVAGITESGNFPTASASQAARAGKKDAFVTLIPPGDGSAAAPVLTAGIVLMPDASTRQVGETVTAQFTLTNRGGSILVLNSLGLVEGNLENNVPDFPPLRGLAIDPGDSLVYSKNLVLTETGSFTFQVVYQMPGGTPRTDIPVEEGASSQITITVENTNNNPIPVNTISASTNPCEIRFGGGTCTTTIEWNTVNVEAAAVWVEDAGANTPATLFATGIAGSSDATWIQAPPHRYKFTLFDTSSASRRELAAVEVTGHEADPPARGSIKVSGNPCIIPAGSSTCTTTISWTSSADILNAILFVQDVGVGNPASGVDVGTSGSVEVPWIQGPPHRYIFTLFDSSSSQLGPIAAIEVTGREETGAGNSSGTISASPNPCVIEAGSTICSTRTSWSTADNVEDARVSIADIGVSGAPVRFAAGKSGSVVAQHIEGAPHKYRFTLYQVTPDQVIELSAVEVTGTQ
jgi:hypothetical protein